MDKVVIIHFFPYFKNPKQSRQEINTQTTHLAYGCRTQPASTRKASITGQNILHVPALALLSAIFCTTDSNGNSHTVQSHGPSIPVSLLGFRNADFLLLLDLLAQRTDLNHSAVGFPLPRCQSKNYETPSCTGCVC